MRVQRVIVSGLSDEQVAALDRALAAIAAPGHTDASEGAGSEGAIQLVTAAQDELAAKASEFPAAVIALAATDTSIAVVGQLRVAGVRHPVLLVAPGSSRLDASPELGAVVSIASASLEDPASTELQTALAQLAMLSDLVEEVSSLRQQLREVEETRFQQRIEIEHLSRHLEAIETDDELTGLRSEKAMARSIDEAFNLARRHQTAVACLVIGVDEFEQLTGRFGDAFAEFVLVQIAHRLKTCMRQTDLLSRYGDGTFLMLSPFTTEEGSKALAERLQEAVSGQRLEYEGEKLTMALSVGLANWRLQMTNSSELVEAAVTAANEARKRGGGVHVA